VTYARKLAIESIGDNSHDVEWLAVVILEAMAYERERCALIADERCGPKVCHQDAAARIRALPPAPEKP
jgi:hypothetical protein